MADQPDAALVHSLALLHVTQLEEERGKAFPRQWRQEMEQRLAQAIEQAIEAEVEAIERELPEE